MKHWTLLLVCALAAAACDRRDDDRDAGRVSGTTTDRSDTTTDRDRTDTTNAPDNTGRNVRDREGTTTTPVDQGGTKADLDRTAEIRRRVTDDDALSANAKNVKIITLNGRVTLRGPVDSATEKDTIERIAREVAGDANVSSEIEIANAR